MELHLTAPAATVRADAARRIISGLGVPWDTFATVSTGQTVSFARGSLRLSDRSKLVLDHDPSRPVGVYRASADTPDGLEMSFYVPEGPAGDAVLAEAASGLRDGLSVAADVTGADDTDDGLIVTSARVRHVALLSEPAFDNARVSSVHAQKGEPMTDAVTSPPEAPQSPQEPTAPPVEVSAALTPAGLAAAAYQPAPVRVRDPYPYALPLEMGGPSFVRDAWSSQENPGSPEADRWRRAQLMASDPANLRAATNRFARLMTAPPADIAAATGTTTGSPALTPAQWMPERFVPLKAAKAPLYSLLTKFAVPDFSTIDIPRTMTETGLSGAPADEVTPIAAGDITVGNDAIVMAEVEGAYNFSRKLLMTSNPQIDRIALDAMDRAWLADVETRAVAFFTTAANHTPVAVTYADALTYIAALRADLASMATGVYTPSDIVPPQKEYVALAIGSYTSGVPILPMPPVFNVAGVSDAGFQALHIQGIPIHPGRYMLANKTLIIDQATSDSAVVWQTPVMNFRLEWTDTGAAGGGNVKVLKLVKYSGVGFWSQYPGGIHCFTNSTPLPFDVAGDDQPTFEAASSEGPNGGHRTKKEG